MMKMEVDRWKKQLNIRKMNFRLSFAMILRREVFQQQLEITKSNRDNPDVDVFSLEGEVKSKS